MSHTTIEGNLTRDPELRFSQSGTAWATFGMASNRRVKDGNDYKDVPTFWTVKVFGSLAENVAESLSRGDRVLAAGVAELEEWEKDGAKQRTLVLIADEVGVALRWATARPVKGDRKPASKPAAKRAAEPGEEPF